MDDDGVEARSQQGGRPVRVSRWGGRLRTGLVCGVMGAACGDRGDAVNVFPTGSDSGTSTSSSDSAMSTDGTTASDAASSGVFLIDCLHVQQLGEPGDVPLQGRVLENAWRDHIASHKLNVMFEVLTGSNAQAPRVGVRSGIGSHDDDQCVEPRSRSEIFEAQWRSLTTHWSPGDDEVCAVAGAREPPPGSVVVEFGGDALAFIYAQDDDETPFNCTPDRATVDAVPLRALSATLTMSEDRQRVSGSLTACILESDARGLCSCLGECLGEGLQSRGACAGCPSGGVPLDQLLGGIAPSRRCSTLLGGPAFDLGLTFRANALTDRPPLCPVPESGGSEELSRRPGGAR